MKKVLIVGCGAIGSLFAAHLAKGGEVEVYAFDVSQAHVDAINRNGLRLSGASDVHVRLAKASTDPSRASGLRLRHRRDQGDPHRLSASRAAARCFDDNSAVCSVQNGVGNEEIIAEHVKYVIRGTTFPAGHVVEPGHVGFDIQGDTWVGPFEPTRTPMHRVEELAGLLTARRDEYHCPAGCARCAMDQADLQRGHQSRGSAHPAASWGRIALSADRRAVRGAHCGRRGGGEGDGHRTARRSGGSGCQGRKRSGQTQLPACCRMCSRTERPRWIS